MEVLGFLTVQLGPTAAPAPSPTTASDAVEPDDLEPMALGDAVAYMDRELAWAAPGRPLWRAWHGILKALPVTRPPANDPAI